MALPNLNHRICVALSQPQHDAISTAADAAEVTFSDVLRSIINDWRRKAETAQAR